MEKEKGDFPHSEEHPNEAIARAFAAGLIDEEPHEARFAEPFSTVASNTHARTHSLHMKHHSISNNRSYHLDNSDPYLTLSGNGEMGPFERTGKS